jgi:hypothetical protein
MAKGIVDVGRKIVSMNQVFLSEVEVVRVTNKKFVTVNREDLAGEFDMEVDISTAEIDNNKAQDLGFMLQTIGNNMDFGIVKIILAEIARLKRMPVLQEAILRFEPTPDPLLEEAKKLEVEKLRYEIEKIKSETQRNNADAEKKLAEANQTDLDTIEQETGTTHERELEKQRAQAQGNQDLVVAKALVTPRKKADGVSVRSGHRRSHRLWPADSSDETSRVRQTPRQGSTTDVVNGEMRTLILLP